MQRDAFINTRDLTTNWSEPSLVSDLQGGSPKSQRQLL
jgi:hypothetical protein